MNSTGCHSHFHPPEKVIGKKGTGNFFKAKNCPSPYLTYLAIKSNPSAKGQIRYGNIFCGLPEIKKRDG
jgi:hypothetical protein